MNLRVLFLICALASFSNANAVLVLVSLTTPPAQVDRTSSFTVSMKVTGKTTSYAVSAAGGFTVQCEYNSLPITAETSK
jgi:hypothetical protein